MAKEGTKKKNAFASFFSWLGNDIKEIGVTFKEGDFRTRLSFLFFGLGPILRGQFVTGFALLLTQIAVNWYFVGFGWDYLSKLNTLGTIETVKNSDGTFTYGDNSFLILLYGLLSIVIVFIFILLWRINVRENYKEQNELKAGKNLPTNGWTLKSLLDSNFDKTLLTLPVVGIFLFTMLPIMFMICIAFTNYDATHQSPSKLFTWVGLENFKNLFSFDATGYGKTFMTVLLWTLVWSLFATFLNYFLGMGVAMLINRKGIKFKKLWRTILIMTIAVPQFISLLYMYKMFAADGMVNTYLMKWGWITEAIPFWTQANYARVMIILINLWIGIPYMMLISTGILMNIPADLYESAKIDGASGWQAFKSITLPYMMFVTGPYLLSQYIGNLNNFNVIYLLNQGKPQSMMMVAKAGYTDLLVTWLYKMTVNDTNYRMAACIGIMVFVVTAVISLVVYGLLPSVKDEEGFQ